MVLHWSKNETAYDAAVKAITDRYGCGESFVVQLRINDGYHHNLVNKIELLINDGIDFEHPDYVWEYDWWEGEEHIELVAAAPISEIELSEEQEF